MAPEKVNPRTAYPERFLPSNLRCVSDIFARSGANNTKAYAEHFLETFDDKPLSAHCQQRGVSMVLRQCKPKADCLSEHIACAKDALNPLASTLAHPKEANLPLDGEKVARGLVNVVDAPSSFCGLDIGIDTVLNGCFGASCEEVSPGAGYPQGFTSCATGVGLLEGVMHPASWAQDMQFLTPLSEEARQRFCWTAPGKAVIEKCLSTPCGWQEPRVNLSASAPERSGLNLVLHYPTHLPERFIRVFEKAAHNWERLIDGARGAPNPLTMHVNVTIKDPYWSSGPARGGAHGAHYSGTQIPQGGEILLEKAYLDPWQQQRLLESAVMHELGHVILPLHPMPFEEAIAKNETLAAGVIEIKGEDGQSYCYFTGVSSGLYFDHLGGDTLLADHDPRRGRGCMPSGCAGHPDRDILVGAEGAANVMNNAWDGPYVTQSLIHMLKDRGYHINGRQEKTLHPGYADRQQGKSQEQTLSKKTSQRRNHPLDRIT
ncbi:hypothetical protein EIL50_05260 [bacterium NHP-B]|nr:hypothetical protein EIL50_05260 [bacterium NHP-B]